MKSLVPFALALLAGAGGALAQTAPADAGGRRVSQLIVYGDDPCPQSSDEEVVVCARRPEEERFRIPEALRESSEPRDNEAWAARARSLEYVGRTGIQSCSTVGPGGFTGCWAEMMRQAREDRRANPEGQPVP